MVSGSLTLANREPSFHRLGQLIVDYDDPLRQMHKDFAPHIKIIADLLATLRPEVEKRHLSADMLRKNFVGAILHNHAKVLRVQCSSRAVRARLTRFPDVPPCRV